MAEAAPVAVITGSGGGLGRAVAERFIAGGYRAVGLDHRPGTGCEGLTELATDITDASDVDRAFDQVQELGNPEVLVNAAGVYPRSTLADATSHLYRLIFDVNVLGTVLVTQAFMRCRDADTRGSVINVASIDGLRALPTSILYSASKAAVANLTEGIAAELAEQNVRVHGIAPAYIATDRVAALAGERALENAATPAQVAATCWDLSRPDSLALMTGQTVVLRKSCLDGA